MKYAIITPEGRVRREGWVPEGDTLQLNIGGRIVSLDVDEDGNLVLTNAHGTLSARSPVGRSDVLEIHVGS
jgi:hypothetical protein